MVVNKSRKLLEGERLRGPGRKVVCGFGTEEADKGLGSILEIGRLG